MGWISPNSQASQGRIHAGLARLGVPQPIAERLLAHRSGATIGGGAIDNRYNYEAERRATVDKWESPVARVTD